MKVTFEQLQNIIRDQKFTWLKIKDTSGNMIYMLSEGKTSEAKVKTEDVVTALTTFLSQYPGLYNFEFKKYPTAASGEIFRYSLMSMPDHGTGGAIHHMGSSRPVNVDEIRKQVREELQSEYETKRKLDEVEELKAEYHEKLKELEMPAGKLGIIIEKVFMNLSGKSPALRGVLQGNADKETEAEAETREKNYTQEQIDTINSSLDDILSVMDVDTFKLFADKVKKDPSVITFLKSFIK